MLFLYIYFFLAKIGGGGYRGVSEVEGTKKKKRVRKHIHTVQLAIHIANSVLGTGGVSVGCLLDGGGSTFAKTRESKK